MVTSNINKPTKPSVNLTANQDGTITVAGQSQANYEIDITYPNGQKVVTIANGDGSFSTTSPTPQTTGAVSVIVKDSLGNVSPTVTKNFIDRVAPEAPNVTIHADDKGYLTVTGTAEVGSHVKIIYPNGLAQTVTIDSTGVFTTTSVDVQPTGQVKVRATDVAGNQSVLVEQNYVDQTPPSLPTSMVITNPNSTLTVSGTTEPNSVVKVTYPDGTSSTITSSSTGHYSVISANPQSSGEVSVSSTDASGNTSAINQITYEDTTAPSQPTDTKITGNTDGTVTVSGIVEPNTTVKVTYPDGTTATVKATDNGAYSITSSTPQNSGNLSVVTTDASGNSSPSLNQNYVDRTAPDQPLVSNILANKDGTITVSGQAEPNSTVKVTYPDGTTSTATVGTNGSYSTTSSTPQTSGNVSAMATDVAGNTSSATQQSYTDTTAPTAPSDTAIKGNDDGTITVSGQAEPNSTVKVTYPDGTTSTATAGTDGTYSTTSSTPQTSGNVSTTATDTAGNTSSATQQSYTDTTVPTAPSDTAIKGNDDGTVTVSGQAEPNSTVKVTYPDGTTSTATASTDGSYSTTSSTPQTSGNVSATATDTAGNTSSATQQSYTDTTAPTAPSDTAVKGNDDGTITVSGQAEPNSTVKVTYPDGTTSTANVGTGGTYSTASSTPQTSGNVSATATDTAGNTSSATQQSYTDTTAPT
uniref:Ig-like domain-containing protein n=1 Tax=Acinetobacter sp. HY1485 TaxID=2970918 RepID=UPI0022B984C2